MTTQEKISNIEILEKIKQYRNQKNLSQAQVAAVIGISQAAYAKVESGITENISLNIAKGIAKALGENFNELFEINADNKNLDIQTDEIEELKGKIKELQDRIEEKDLLIKTITTQSRYTKAVLIAEVYLYYYHKYAELIEKIENAGDEDEKKKLKENLDYFKSQEKRKFKAFVMQGVLDQNDLDEMYDNVKENTNGYFGNLQPYA